VIPRVWRPLSTVIIAATLATPCSVSAQQDTARLDPVVVTVTRGHGKSVLQSPFALSVAQPDSERPGQRHTSIDESLSMIPGLTVVSRNNPSQDPRLSVRGFGSRSAFGVRGVRVLRDGMPLTLPDGQTPLDYMSLESVGRVEVMRGAASAIYGNASGGVIDIQTAAPPPGPVSGRVAQWLGGSSFQRTAVAAGGTAGSSYYQADAAFLRTDGSRAHSRQRSTTGFARAGTTAGGTDFSLSILAFDNPLAENPGALTRDELKADPYTADALSVRRDARKAVKQIQAGLSGVHQFVAGEVSALVFAGARSLDNPLTFNIVEVGRHTYGASAHVSQTVSLIGSANRLSAGVDYQSQNDLRRNFATCADTIQLTTPTATCPTPGSERGIFSLDQRELVKSWGVYFNDDAPLGERLIATAGIRADNVAFEVKDRLVSASNPDDSGRRSLGSVTPVFGMVMRITARHSLYANVAGAFETPTATELGNHPDGSAGINQSLNPQKSLTSEAGAKGFLGSALSYDLAAYSTRVIDELVPFEIPDSNGRRYFRNAGRTTRRGFEAGARLKSGPLSLMGAYTFSAFRFDSYRTGNLIYDGNTIPGIPRNRLQAAVTMTGRPGFATIEEETAGSVFLDDANSTMGPGYASTNVRLGGDVKIRNSVVSVSTGVQNLFDRHYASSVAVNAARGKYFEPAATRNFFIGVSVSAARFRPDPVN
jgi:iron complex outermembrane receptor protein